MNCETLLQYLSDYIDRNLEAELEAEAQEHLATCQNCQVVLDSTQKAILLSRQQSQIVIPAERRQKLYQQLESIFKSKTV